MPEIINKHEKENTSTNYVKPFFRSCMKCTHRKICAIYIDINKAMLGKPEYNGNPIIEVDNLAIICQMYKEEKND